MSASSALSKRPLRSVLDNVPMDLLIEIVGFLPPNDIIVVGRVCKALFEASRTRIVWVNALRRVAFERGIYMPTFPIDDMKIDQLVHAATSPARFLSCLYRGLDTKSVKPISTRMLMHSSGSALIDGIYLIPGGRFIIVSTEAGTIQLWDLGFCSDTVIHPDPVATMEAGESTYVQSLAPSSDSLGIRLVILEENSKFPIINIVVYEIYPESLHPTFLHIASMSLPVDNIPVGPSLLACLFGELFLVHYTNQVIAWDFVRDRWVGWQTTIEAKNLLVCEQTVFLLDNTNMDIYKIPDLCPRAGGSDVPLKRQRLLQTIHLDIPAHYDAYIIETSRWSTVPSNFFDIVLTNEDGDIIKIRHCALTTAYDLVTHQPFHLPVTRGEIHFARYNWLDTSVHKSVWTGPQEFFFFASSCGKVLASVSHMSDTGVHTVAGPMWTGRLDEGWNFQICPFSGRLCMPIRGDDYLDIRVMDYLAPNQGLR